MAKKISNKDIFEDGLFAPAKKNAEALNKELIKLEAGLKGIAAVAKSDLKKLKIVNFSDVQKGTKAIKEIDAAYKGLSEVEKQRLKLREQERKAGKQLQAARSKEFKQLQEANLAKQKQTKAVKDELRETSKLSSEYERQSAKLNRLRKNLKNLILTEGEGTAKTKKLAAEVGKLDTKLKNADAAAGQFQRNVGNYPKGLSKAVGALKNFAGALGITAGIAGLVRVMGNAVKIAKDFEQGNANLAAVLGKTKDQIGALTDDAKRLGAATAFSATQVSGLQVEFAKLGFTEKEILAATEATLSLAAATGSDLGEAAAIAGATLGGFGLGANETQRVVDVMAKSFSTSALDIEKFKESMKNAAPAAKAVGISVEETTALLGTLANAGISGSKAGNNLKTSFINLNKAGLTLEQGLEKVANSEDKLGTAAELVGKNAAASFLVLSEGVDVTKELTTGLENAGGAAEKMAKEQLDTLQGSLTILNSAWEGFVLGLLSGDSAFSNMARSIVEGTTAFLGMITATENESDALIKQQIELNSLVGAVTDVNNTEETRKKLIEELNKKYPKFLENLDQEKVTNEQLVLRLKDVNKELEKKIVIKQKEEKLTELIEEQLELRIAELDVIKDLSAAQKSFDKAAGTQIRTSEGLVDAQLLKVDALNREQSALKVNRDRQTEIAAEIAKISELYDGLTPKIDETSEAIVVNTGATEENTKAKQESRLTDAEIQKARQQRLDLDFDRDKQRDDENQKRLDAAAERQRLRNQLALTHERGLAAEKERNRLAEEKAEIAAAKAAAKRREEQFETAKQYLELTSEAFSEGVDKEEKEQDAAIKRREESVSLQQSRAEQGLENTLAFEKEQLAKAELERARTAEKRAKQEEALALAQAFLNAFAARAKDDPDTAAAKALTDVILAKALSETVAGAFAEGVEDFKGEGTGTSDSNLIRFSHGESVVTAKGTKDNQGLVTAMNNGDVGSWFANNMMLSPLSSEKNYDSFGILAQKIESIEKAIKNRPTSQTNLDNMGNVMQSTYRNGIKNTVKYLNARPRI